jgi:hypothetical protein
MGCVFILLCFSSLSSLSLLLLPLSEKKALRKVKNGISVKTHFFHSLPNFSARCAVCALFVLFLHGAPHNAKIRRY